MTYRLHFRLVTPLVSLLQLGSLRLQFYIKSPKYDFSRVGCNQNNLQIEMTRMGVNKKCRLAEQLMSGGVGRREGSGPVPVPDGSALQAVRASLTHGVQMSQVS